jgi:hypothetical protein
LGTTTESPDGTFAAAQASILQVRLLDIPSMNFDGGTLALGHMEAVAKVPAGGISCALDVTKVSSTPTVTSGSTFTTTINVTNPYDCPVKAVRVTDDITTTGLALFKIQSSSPAADSSTSGDLLKDGSVVWNNIGDIPPHGSKSVSVTLVAQGTVGTIRDTATATGTFNCGDSGSNVEGLAATATGVGLTGTAGLTVPTTVGAQVLGTQELARTGPPAVRSILAGLALMGLALGLSRLRRFSG